MVSGGVGDVGRLVPLAKDWKIVLQGQFRGSEESSETTT